MMVSEWQRGTAVGLTAQPNVTSWQCKAERRHDARVRAFEKMRKDMIQLIHEVVQAESTKLRHAERDRKEADKNSQIIQMENQLAELQNEVVLTKALLAERERKEVDKSRFERLEGSVAALQSGTGAENAYKRSVRDDYEALLKRVIFLEEKSSEIDVIKSCVLGHGKPIEDVIGQNLAKFAEMQRRIDEVETLLDPSRNSTLKMSGLGNQPGHGWSVCMNSPHRQPLAPGPDAYNCMNSMVVDLETRLEIVSKEVRVMGASVNEVQASIKQLEDSFGNEIVTYDKKVMKMQKRVAYISDTFKECTSELYKRVANVEKFVQDMIENEVSDEELGCHGLTDADEDAAAARELQE